MIIQFTNDNFQINNVKIIYFDENLSNTNVKEMVFNKNKVYEIEINCNDNVIYKFIINDQYYINDPRANEYIYIDDKGYWSKISKTQLKYNKNIPIISTICICKNISSDINPIEETRIINSLDKFVFCWCKLSNIQEDVLVNMIWTDPSNEVFSAVELLVKYDKRDIRTCYTGINLENIVDSDIIKKGKWTVYVYVNGSYVKKISFVINKFQTYSRNGIINRNYKGINIM